MTWGSPNLGIAFTSFLKFQGGYKCYVGIYRVLKGFAGFAVSQSEGYDFGGPYNEDYRLRVYIGVPSLGNRQVICK